MQLCKLEAKCRLNSWSALQHFSLSGNKATDAQAEMPIPMLGEGGVHRDSTALRRIRTCSKGVDSVRTRDALALRPMRYYLLKC